MFYADVDVPRVRLLELVEDKIGVDVPVDADLSVPELLDLQGDVDTRKPVLVKAPPQFNLLEVAVQRFRLQLVMVSNDQTFVPVQPLE